MRPVVAVTGPDRGGAPAWLFTKMAVKRAGGLPVRVTPSTVKAGAHFDGLILGGGADVGPNLYGAERRPDPPDPPIRERTWRMAILDLLIYPLTWLFRVAAERLHLGEIDAARDALEMKLLRRAYEKDLPILGICRGEQLLNVFFGGTLNQDLSGLYVEDPEIRTIFPRKNIYMESDSLLARILGPMPHRVNALHRQGVQRLGNELRVSARDKNGIVQALEHVSRPFILGVQWHPEYMPQVVTQQRIFAYFVHAARTAAEERQTPKQQAAR